MRESVVRGMSRAGGGVLEYAYGNRFEMMGFTSMTRSVGEAIEFARRETERGGEGESGIV